MLPFGVKDFIRRWWANFRPLLLTALALIGFVAGVLPIFRAIDEYTVWFFVIFMIIILLPIVIYSKPKPRKSAINYIYQEIDIGNIDDFYDIDRKIGLLGMRNVGKTTFLECISKKMHSHRQTETPYFVLIPIVENKYTKYIAIIDSVGQSINNQFQIMNMSDVAVIFFDHSEGEAVSRERITAQAKFAFDLSTSIKEQNLILKKCVLVINKYDLWVTQNPAEVLRVYDMILQSVVNLRNFESVDTLLEHSNHDHDKIVRLLDLVSRERASSRNV